MSNESHDHIPNLPTLQDVANLANVSTATVSRCLNNPDRVVKETRDRVLQAVQSLGYSPNFGARLMAAKRSNTIGAVIPTMENALFAQGLQAFQDELQAAGYTLLVASSSYNQEMEAEHIRTLVARGADALLLIGHDRNQEIKSFLEIQNIPYLIAWTFSKEKNHPSIGFDNLEAMYDLTRKVLEHGHKTIGVISADPTMNDRARDRITGIRKAVTDAGIPSKNLHVEITNYSIDDGASALRKLMLNNPFPTAIICGNDVLAAGALKAAQESDIAVPSQLSITGFDDMELAKVTSPRLTTVKVPHTDMGREAAKALIEFLEKKNPMKTIKLNTGFVEGETLGNVRTPN